MGFGTTNADIIFVTASDMPKPDPETHLLVEVLAQKGINSDVRAWDSPTDWEKTRLVVIRSTWDYFNRLPEFLSWAEHVENVSKLVNPFKVVQWNCHKRYLLDLSGQGVPSVPTLLFQQHAQRNGDLLSDCKWKNVVIKPAISVGAIGALHTHLTKQAEDHLADLLVHGDALVQPFVDSVINQGEVSMIYFGGTFSHAIQKRPKVGEYRVQDHYGGTVHSYSPSQDEYEIATAALAASPDFTTYARVDLVRLEGQPVVMELELIEPELFLPKGPSSAHGFVEQLLKTLSQ